MKAKRRKTNRPGLTQLKNSQPQNPRMPFMEHLMELRKRIFYVALSVIAWSVGAYFVQHQIVQALLKPAENQKFIYTSVGGGIDFLFRVCIYTGIVFSIPVVVFQLLKYLQPLIKKDAVRFINWGSIVSGVLALAGMAFGYFLGLPAALHFLLHQFTSEQIQPLLTIQSYMSFVTLYMLGSAFLFQLPLIMALINRIKPLKPKKLLGCERWVILLAFIGGGIMNPSPRVQDQLLLAVPMIAAYQVGILLVWRMNRKGRSKKITKMLEEDAQARAARYAKFEEARAELQKKLAEAPAAASVQPVAVTVAPPRQAQNTAEQKMDVPAPTPTQPRSFGNPAIQRRRYFNDVARRPAIQTANRPSARLETPEIA